MIATNLYTILEPAHPVVCAAHGILLDHNDGIDSNVTFPALLPRNGQLAKNEQAEQLKAQLVVSLGRQNLLMYGVEGLREVTASVMAGLAFVATSNLAAPLAGSIAVQVRQRGGGELQRCQPQED
jgi:hypothetical protein